MKVLVINSGSSSIKFQLINMESGNVLAKGLLERIGLEGSQLVYKRGEEKKVDKTTIKDHEQGVDLIVHYLTSSKDGVIKDVSEIYAVGHRVVHAGEYYKSTAIITDEVMTALRAVVPLAPLHNPANIIGIEATQHIMPGIPMAAVFDTAFHQSMPEKAYIYPIPYKYYKQNKIRRYGFHGTSHFFVAKQGAKRLERKLRNIKVITCHLGNGSSMAAIKNGRSIDTTMGFTPLEGLMMGTRCGDIDPAIVMYLQRAENLSYQEIDSILNKQSGIKGVSEISSDMRDIENSIEQGDLQAMLAQDIYAYRIKKYIGAYIAAMNGVDLIIFTAGIGERDIQVRKKVLEKLQYLGIILDPEANRNTFGTFGIITTPDSRVTAMVIPTNEELEIAQQTVAVVGKQLLKEEEEDF